MRKAAFILGMTLLVALLLTVACTNNPAAPKITRISMVPESLATNSVGALTVVFTGTSPTFAWREANNNGSFDHTNLETVNWTAPGTVGTYIVWCKVTTADGDDSLAKDVIVYSGSASGSPVINSLTAANHFRWPAEQTNITVVATNSPTSYTWTADYGTVTGTGATVSYTTPSAEVDRYCHILCRATNSQGSDTMTVWVTSSKGGFMGTVHDHAFVNAIWAVFKATSAGDPSPVVCANNWMTDEGGDVWAYTGTPFGTTNWETADVPAGGYYSVTVFDDLNANMSLDAGDLYSNYPVDGTAMVLEHGHLVERTISGFPDHTHSLLPNRMDAYIADHVIPMKPMGPKP